MIGGPSRRLADDMRKAPGREGRPDYASVLPSTNKLGATRDEMLLV